MTDDDYQMPLFGATTDKLHVELNKANDRIAELESMLESRTKEVDRWIASYDQSVYKQRSALQEQVNRIAELESQWISVEDRFPDNSQNGGVWAINDEGDVFLATSNDGWWCIGGANPMTHWMPLPEPPKGQG